ncbi:MAG: HypC/HybG/HupF family hydrogenase formation chaperone [Patescibacteria group bacterium]|nr:HypC/HybG/HupF family hydrogenase formation chaperone [Patescibacteria group bacterium]
MCLAIPGKIIGLKGEKAVADFRGIRKEINISLVPAKIGDYAMVHAGFAIELVHPEDTRVNPPAP